MDSGLIIRIETTNLKKNMQEGEDLTQEQDKEFHAAVAKVIERHIHSDNFEQLVMEEVMHEAEFSNPKNSEFSDIGSVMIKIQSSWGLKNG